MFCEKQFFLLTCNNDLPPQELLSHSTDRPERQQLKEALEAMQVCALSCSRLYTYVCMHACAYTCNMLHNNAVGCEATVVYWLFQKAAFTPQLHKSPIMWQTSERLVQSQPRFYSFRTWPCTSTRSSGTTRLWRKSANSKVQSKIL